MNQDSLAIHRLAVPPRLIIFSCNELAASPAPFVFGPAVLIVAVQEHDERLIDMRKGEVRVEYDGSLEPGHRFVVLCKLQKRTAEVVVRQGRVRVKLDRAFCARGGFLMLAEHS